MKKGKRGGMTRISYKDKKGHQVFGVSYRTINSSAFRIPYFYCPKCDRFISVKNSEVFVVVV